MVSRAIPYLRVVPAGLLFLIGLLACATYNPRPLDEVPFKARAQTQSKGNVRVTAAVLSAKESEAVFSLPLYDEGIQPVWLKIENDNELPVWFAPISVDPNYYAPLEVAYYHHTTWSSRYNDQMNQYFREHTMRRYIGPRSVRSGFVFTNLDQGTKDFNVELLWDGDPPIMTFTFFMTVPGLRADHRDVDWKNLYSQGERISYNEDGLRNALKTLPCCTTNADGTREGNPINVILIGEGKAVGQALLRAGWDETASRTGSSASFEEALPEVQQDRYASAARQYLFGRGQDATFRKLRGSSGERQLRLWLSPMTLDGVPVWIGQIGHYFEEPSDSTRTPTFTMQPDVDQARNYLVYGLWYSRRVAKRAWLKAVDAAPFTNQRETSDGVSYFTDGYQYVIWVFNKPVSPAQVMLIDWDTPPDYAVSK